MDFCMITTKTWRLLQDMHTRTTGGQNKSTLTHDFNWGNPGKIRFINRSFYRIKRHISVLKKLQFPLFWKGKKQKIQKKPHTFWYLPLFPIYLYTKLTFSRSLFVVNSDQVRDQNHSCDPGVDPGNKPAYIKETLTHQIHLDLQFIKY